MDAMLVLTNLPDVASAHALAAHLVAARLAACVNILAPCRSIYHWEGKIEDMEEVPLLIKTTAARYPEIETAIQAQHPYDLPEIIVIPIELGLPEYLDWLDEVTTPTRLP